jgi:predicted SAM-dependent methyltransferase
MTLLLDLRSMAFAGAHAQGQYLELGGGEGPVIRPNLDVRPGPSVDIVHDLEKTLPVRDGRLDTVFSRYVLEHVSWRRLPSLLAECVAALKPGGSLIAIVPDTEAQMRHLLRSQDWPDGGSMLFGGQDYPENSHRAFISVHLLQKWLTDAGCDRVLCCAHGEKGTDAVVQAWKGLFGGSAPEAPAATAEGALPKMKVRVGAGLDMAFPEGWKVSLKPGGQGLRAEGEGVNFYAEGDELWAEGPLSEGFAEGEGGFWLPEVREPPLYEPEKVFTRDYFDGGRLGGGYLLYLDFPHGHSVAQKILAKRPGSVIDVGGGRGHLARRLQAAGVVADVLEVSKHCGLTRVVRARDFHEGDATEPGVWARHYVPSSIDLAVSVDLLDTVPQHRLADLVACLAKYTRRGLHAVSTQPPRGDRTRVTFKPLSWWQSVLPEGHGVVSSEEMKSGALPQNYLQGDGKSKLNLGSHAVMFHDGWENIDAVDLTAFAQQNGYRFRRHDLREGLPHATASVDLAYSSHLLEHLTYDEGLRLLRSLRRCMKSGGALRILVPDALKLMLRYNDGEMSQLDQMSATVERAGSEAAKLHAVLYEHHASAYDESALGALLRQAGFVWAPGADFGGLPHGSTPADLQLLRETHDCLPQVSLVACARVP